jgi:hypothetical protein
MFSQRLAGHSAARITRALNDAGVPCPSAADPGRNPNRTGAAWTLRTVAAILANPRYTGRQVWNRQRTDFDLIDPVNTALGHKQVQRWNLPEGWVISKQPAHAALVSEADFIKARTLPYSADRPPRRRAGTCSPGCSCADGAGGVLNQRGPTAGPPTGAATATSAPSARNQDGPATLTCARTRSFRTWPRSASCSPAQPGPLSAGT